MMTKKQTPQRASQSQIDDWKAEIEILRPKLHSATAREKLTIYNRMSILRERLIAKCSGCASVDPSTKKVRV